MLSILVLLSLIIAAVILARTIEAYSSLKTGVDGESAKTVWSQDAVTTQKSETSTLSWISFSNAKMLEEIKGQILKSISNATYTYLAVSALTLVGEIAPSSDLCLVRWITTDEKFDPDWICTIKGTNTSVEALTFDGQGRLYVGGSFTSVQFETQLLFVNSIMRFSLEGNLDESWRPPIAGTVYAIDCTTSKVYIGGNLSKAGTRGKHGYFDFIDESGNPIWFSDAHNIDQNIYGCTLYDGKVYMCGNHDYGTSNFVNFGRAEVYTGEMDTLWRSGQPTLRTFGANLTDTASCITVDENVVFCGSAARDLAEESQDGWYTSWGAPNPIPTLVAYLTRPNMYMSRSTGLTVNPFQLSLAQATSTTSAWYCTFVDYERHERYLGGFFTTVRHFAAGSTTSLSNPTRNNIARFLNSDTLDHYGAVDLDWDPNANERVYCMLLSGDYVYLGGRFTTLGGVSAPYLGRVARASTGALDTSWMPAANGTVRAMAISDDVIYFGGDFTSVAGQTRNRAAAVRLSNMELLDWNPNITDGSVYAIAVTDTYVFVGGSFTSPYPYLFRGPRIGSNRSVAALTRIEVNSTVRCLLAHSSGGIFVGGDFTVDTTSPSTDISTIVAWGLEANELDEEYSISLNGPVYCIRTFEDDIVQYIGGQFSQVIDQSGSKSFSLVIRYLLDSNAVDNSFQITNSPTGAVRVLELLGDSTQLLIGGSWSNTLTSKLARIDKGTGEVDQTWLPKLNGDVVSFEKRDQTLVVWGTFSTVDSQQQEGLVVFKDWQLNPVRFFPTQRSISWVTPWQNDSLLVSFSDRRLVLLIEPNWEIVSTNQVKLV